MCLVYLDQVFFALTMSAAGISQASATAPDVNKVKDSAASIFELLDSEPKIDSSKEEGITLTNVRGEIHLLHVSFKYPTRPDIPIFRDLCLSIPSGKVYLSLPSQIKSVCFCMHLFKTDPSFYRQLLLLERAAVENQPSSR